ncbi:MAG: hypothetical protein ROO76_06590 [Terriglobia bacterium]|nr:hypothetical protein [Terriglobia bacterium]
MARVLEWNQMVAAIHIVVKWFLLGISTLFGIGVVGSTIVLILSFWEDLKTVLGHN